MKSCLEKVISSYLSHPDARKMVYGAVLKVAEFSLTFLMSYMLAKLLLPEVFGEYSIILAYVNILTIPFSLGMGVTALRKIASLNARGFPAVATQYARWFAFSVSVISVLPFLGLLIYFSLNQDKNAWVWLMGSLLLCLLVILRVNASIIRGYGDVLSGQLVGSALRIFFFITFVGASSLYVYSQDQEISLTMVMMCQIISAAFSLLAACYLIRRRRTGRARYTFRIQLICRYVSVSILVTLLVQVLNRNLDIILIGFFHSPEDAATFQIVYRVAELTSFGILIANMTLGPSIVRAISQGDVAEIRKLQRHGFHFMVLWFLPPALFFTMFSQFVLAFFDEHYISGSLALKLLIASRVMIILSGPVVLFLHMKKKEVVVAKALAASLLLHLVLDFILIPDFGLEGAACSSVASNAVWTGILTVMMKREFGFLSGIWSLWDK